MNDRLKFRAWDNGNMIMHYDFQYIKSGDEGNDWIIFQSDKQKLKFDDENKYNVNVYPNPYFSQQLDIMQSTGLNDKNGKLIYEGDIVKETLTDFIDEEIITVVKWDKLNAIYNLENLQNCEREVIGNIYETPELLNSEVV